MAIGIIIAFFCPANLIAPLEHGNPLGQEERGQKISFLPLPQFIDFGIISGTFNPEIPIHGKRIALLRVSEELEKARRKVLRKYRSERKDSDVRNALTRLRDAAGADTNVMAPIVEAVQASATLGEISDALREVFGTYDG